MSNRKDFFMQPISEEIWASKYQLKGKDGNAIEADIFDTFRRVAKKLSEDEKDNELWENKFLELMTTGRFIGAGRIISNAGSEKYKNNTSLINCTVMNQIPDSMEGIMQVAKESARTLQRGSGVGYDFSTIRPQGALVRGVGSGTSGPLSFMDIYDKMCFTIQSAGGRRGAQMGLMDCQHPDIMDYIKAKREDGKLRQFNLSVLITKKFMKSVINNQDWELWFWQRPTNLNIEDIESHLIKVIKKGDIPYNYPEYRYFSFAADHIEAEYGNITPEEIFIKKVYQRIPAQEIWNLIMKSTYDYAEPGFILIDEVNKKNNLWWLETIRATNPCVTSDTWVQTSEGPLQVENLINKSFTARINGDEFASGEEGFFKTANKEVIELETSDGYKIKLTSDHKIKKVTKFTRDKIETEWCEAGSIKKDEYILLNNHNNNISWKGINNYQEDEGYLMGLLVGDGTFSENNAVLSVWKEANIANGNSFSNTGAYSIMKSVENAILPLKKRSDFSGWYEVSGRNEYRLSLSSITNIAKNLDIYQGNKTITDKVEKSSSQFYIGFIKGLFDADGSVQGSQEKGISIRLAQSNLKTLESTQRMLLRLGVNSKIYKERRKEGLRSLPDGKGGSKLYNTKAQHELIISSENIVKYQNIIGFNDIEKQSKLNNLISNFKRKPNRERFITKLKSTKILGFEDVYDVQVPGINAFDGNGFVCHNCGEQPLPPNGACLLGSMILPAYVKEPFTDNAYFDYEGFQKDIKVAARLLDNVVEYNGLPLKAQIKEITEKRRHGMGFTGLGNTFTMLKVSYGSEESVEITTKISKMLAEENYRAGVELGKEKGIAKVLGEFYPVKQKYLDRIKSKFKKEDISMLKKEGLITKKEIKGSVLHAVSNYFDVLDYDLRVSLALNGSRFTHATTIAPNGTVSLVSNNVSNGIEPPFMFSYFRNVIVEGNKSKVQQEVMDYSYLRYKKDIDPDVTPDKLPSYFVSTETLTAKEHIAVQAAAQKYIDTSISKTINVKTDYPFEDFKDIYIDAYKSGLKGVTTFRFNPNFTTGVLVSEKNLKKTTYEFTLDDGSKVKLKGNEKVIYEGQEHVVSNLYDALKDGYYGKF
jgi:ribonucleoside-diphosphate reductase alpha chain